MTDEPSTLAEESGLRGMLALVALARVSAPEAADDPRYTDAAESIMRIDATLDQVDDAVLAKLMSVDETSQGMLTALIMARLAQVAFALPSYLDAKEFLAPIEQTVDDILRSARPYMS